jgi:hypothetical protein
MTTFPESIAEYKKQLAKGAIQQGYKGLMEYIMGLKTYFQTGHPDFFVSGNIYYGYMDMTYFAFSPEIFKQRKLKIAIVFIHETFRFEVWLAGQNKQVQSKYWEMFKESAWNKYQLVPTTQGADSILEHVLAANPDFGDLDGLTKQIETGTLEFVRDVEGFLVEREN